jgi:hypothetical protein
LRDFRRRRAFFIYSIASDQIIPKTDSSIVFLPDDELVDDYRYFSARRALPPRAIEFIPL